MQLNTTDWKDFLKHESQKTISDYLEEKRDGTSELWQFIDLPEETIESEWTGEEGASEEQLRSTEKRLNVALPPSYRNFLKASNGWNYFLFGDAFRLYSSEGVCWFRSGNQEWIDIWVDSLQESAPIPDEQYFVYGERQLPSVRVEYMQSSLQVSEVLEGSVVLLNPNIVDTRGEWEAWIFSNSIPGAYRYPSFAEALLKKGLTRL